MSNGQINLLFVADVFGNPGRSILSELLPKIVEENGIDFVIVNGENAAGGKGITPKTMQQILDAGVHVITGGNHIWDKRDCIEEVTSHTTLVRPANYGPNVPGRGYNIFPVPDKNFKIAVINLMGRVFIEAPLDCPFRKFDEIYKEVREDADIVFVDFHGEATSEKIAFGHYVDGRAAVVVGTHTHVQTSDEHLLKRGTAYITDAGMTGPKDSVIGVQANGIIQRFLTGLPTRHEVASGRNTLNSVFVSIDKVSKKAISISRINSPELNR